jgi:beta-galactosidase
VGAPDGPLQLGAAAAGTRWVDGLTVTDADVLATYEHPHFGRWPAITTRSHGNGRVTTVGTLPDPTLARALAQWLTPVARSGWIDVPESVTVTTARCPDGRTAHFVHNWSWDDTALVAPVDLDDVLSGGLVPASTSVPLGPWDVRVLVTTGPAPGGQDG